MNWKIEFDHSVEKQLNKLDRQVQKKLLNFLYKRLFPCENPRLFGKALTGDFSDYWSYRVGNYRIIADIQDNRVTIVDHRRQVYDL